MTYRPSDRRSAFRATVAKRCCVAPNGTLPGALPRRLRRLRLPLPGAWPHRALLASLIAGIAYLPVCALATGTAVTRARHTSGVVMIIGGTTTTDDAVTQSTSTPPAKPVAASGESGPLSVVIQPGSSPFPAAARQAFASAASRIMALSPMINEAAHTADVDSALLMAVIEVESGGNPQAVSPKGATGLMQLMPGTGAQHGAADLFDPRQNIAAGARYLKALIRQFDDLPLVLAAYNAGEGAVQKYGGAIPPYAETMSYVPKVMARYRWYQDALSSAGIVFAR